MLSAVAILLWLNGESWRRIWNLERVLPLLCAQTPATYTTTAEDDVQAVACAIILIAAKFPEAIRQLV
jgi:hypothetical protein